MKQKLAVLGAGSWGTTLAKVACENGHEVVLWGNNPEQIDEIKTHHTNRHYLPDVVLPEALGATVDLAEALTGADAVLFVVPTRAIRSVAKQVAPLLTTNPIIIHASNGLEQGTHERISVVLKEELPADQYQDVVVLSGPSHAEELSRCDLTSVTAASANLEAAKYVQELFSNRYFRIYTNTDEVGVEMGAALKNIIAVGAGILHGLGYGDNAKAALMTRGLAEISRLGVAFGADPLTFIGLSGVGDLIVTCTSVHSRNWRAGNELGKGVPLPEILDAMGMVVEGVETCKAAYQLAAEKGIELPITATIYEVLYEGKDVRQAIQDLMSRDYKSENSLKEHQTTVEGTL